AAPALAGRSGASVPAWRPRIATMARPAAAKAALASRSTVTKEGGSAPRLGRGTTSAALLAAARGPRAVTAGGEGSGARRSSSAATRRASVTRSSNWTSTFRVSRLALTARAPPIGSRSSLTSGSPASHPPGQWTRTRPRATCTTRTSDQLTPWRRRGRSAIRPKTAVFALGLGPDVLGDLDRAGDQGPSELPHFVLELRDESLRGS